MPHQSPKRPLVIILEDDHGVRRSTQLLLRGRGFDVKAHGNVDALLADPELDGAACLIADYRLGEDNGITVLERLRARGWSKPAILITAFGTDEIVRRAKAAGFGDVFDKPFKDHVLIGALERALSSGQAAGSAGII